MGLCVGDPELALFELNREIFDLATVVLDHGLHLFGVPDPVDDARQLGVESLDLGAQVFLVRQEFGSLSGRPGGDFREALEPGTHLFGAFGITQPLGWGVGRGQRVEGVFVASSEDEAVPENQHVDSRHGESQQGVALRAHDRLFVDVEARIQQRRFVRQAAKLGQHAVHERVVDFSNDLWSSCSVDVNHGGAHLGQRLTARDGGRHESSRSVKGFDAVEEIGGVPFE